MSAAIPWGPWGELEKIETVTHLSAGPVLSMTIRKGRAAALCPGRDRKVEVEVALPGRILKGRGRVLDVEDGPRTWTLRVVMKESTFTPQARKLRRAKARWRPCES